MAHGDVVGGTERTDSSSQPHTWEAGLSQGLVGFTWVSHPADPFIRSSAWPDPAMGMSVGTHVPPHAP